MSAQSFTEWWRPAGVTEPISAPVATAAEENNSLVPLRALLCFSVILLLAPQQAFPVLAPLRIAMLTAVFALLSMGCSRLARGQPLLEMSRGAWIALILASWAVLTIPFSYWPGGTVNFLLREYFKTLVVFVLLINIVDTVPKLRSICWVLVLCSIPLALTSISHFVSGTLFSENTARIAGYNGPLTANPNDLALVLNILLPFCIALFLSSRRAAIKAFLGVAICLLVAGIIFTFSRGGFLTLAVMFMTYFWVLRKRPERVWAPLALLFALASLPFLPSSYMDRISTITNIEADASGSAQNRWSDMKAATGLAVRSPVIGSGAGMNILAMNEARGATWTEIHNAYLEYAVDLGIPGLVLFLMLYFTCMAQTKAVLVTTSRHRDRDDLFYLAEAVRVSLIGFAVAAFFHPVAYNFYFYYLAGLAIAVNSICQKRYGPLAAAE
ncbi:MAG: O-antigen ligase family protein [Pseudohongiellaceae bacterium]